MNDKKIKKPLLKRWWFWVIVIVVIGVIASTSSDNNKNNTKQDPDKAAFNQNDNNSKDDTDKDTATKEVLYKIGDSFTSGDLGITILEVEEKKEFKSDNQFIKNVTTEGKFIAVEAKLTNNDTKARTFSSTQFKIIDEQDREFKTLTSADLMLILGDKDIFLESCNPGMSRTGIFVFEVPEDLETYSLKVLSGTGFAARTSETVKLK